MSCSYYTVLALNILVAVTASAAGATVATDAAAEFVAPAVAVATTGPSHTT